MVVSACQSHTLFGSHVCAFVYILIHLDWCHLHIQQYTIPIGSTHTVGRHTYLPPISSPLGQNRNWSISYSHLESGDYILLGIVSRRRHTQPCYQSWGIIKQRFCPLSSSGGACWHQLFFVCKGRPPKKYVCVFPHEGVLWCRAWQVSDVVWGNLVLLAWQYSHRKNIYDYGLRS